MDNLTHGLLGLAVGASRQPLRALWQKRRAAASPASGGESSSGLAENGSRGGSGTDCGVELSTGPEAGLQDSSANAQTAAWAEFPREPLSDLSPPHSSELSTEPEGSAQSDAQSLTSSDGQSTPVGAAQPLFRAENEAGRITGTESERSTERAVLIACVLAAELPDIDVLFMMANPVHHALVAHRGWTHTLIGAPVVAALSAMLPWLFDRRARLGTVWGWAMASVLFAHLFADLWTGWGIRLLLPLSDERLRLDWTMVVDPWFTLPLLGGALAALLLRFRPVFPWRHAMLAGLSLTLLYLGGRLALKTSLERQVQGSYPQASVTVFPKFLSILQWRYVAQKQSEQVVGSVSHSGGVVEQGRFPELSHDDIPAHFAQHPLVRDSLSWAQFPVVYSSEDPDGGTQIEILDLRYHWNGQPTLGFVLSFDNQGSLRDSRIERGGSRQEFLQRILGTEPEDKAESLDSRDLENADDAQILDVQTQKAPGAE